MGTTDTDSREKLLERSKRSFAPSIGTPCGDAPARKPIRSILRPEQRNSAKLSIKRNARYETISNRQYEAAVQPPVTVVFKVLVLPSSYPPYMDNYLKEVIKQIEEETGYNLTTGMDVIQTLTPKRKRNWDITIQMNIAILMMVQVASTVIVSILGKSLQLEISSSV